MFAIRSLLASKRAYAIRPYLGCTAHLMAHAAGRQAATKMLGGVSHTPGRHAWQASLADALVCLNLAARHGKVRSCRPDRSGVSEYFLYVSRDESRRMVRAGFRQVVGMVESSCFRGCEPEFVHPLWTISSSQNPRTVISDTAEPGPLYRLVSVVSVKRSATPLAQRPVLRCPSRACDRRRTVRTGR